MKTLKSFLSVVFISFLAFSCGGGGGGSSSSGGSGQVTAQSMDEFVSFLTSNLSGCTSQSVAASVKAINISSMLSSGKDMYDSYQSIPAPIRAIAQAVGVPEEVTGICDNTGSVFVTPTSESNTSIGGSISINGCSIGTGVDAIFIDGSLSFSLQGNDISLGDISSLSASSSGITINAGSESVTTVLNLSASFTTSGTGDLTGLNATITNLSITDNNSSEQFSLTNTNIQASGLDGNVVQLSSSGTYNDSELGTFTFNTPGGLTVDTLSETVIGSIQVNGAGGSDILVTINDDDDIIFQADADGDGNTDFSDTVNCTGLSLDIPVLL